MTRRERSERMSLVRHKDTGPEWTVRKLLSGLGFRYRLHGRHLPGSPDIVFPSRKKAIFVHGCFWHRHPACGRLPKSRIEFWEQKLRNNRARDLRNQRALKRQGWDYAIVWECQLKNIDAVSWRLIDFLDVE